MRYKEFVKYMSNKLNPINISETGEITKDNYFRFSLVLSDAQKETIIAASVTDAVYDALNIILMSKMPNVSEIVCNENVDEMKRKLLSLLDFSQFNLITEKIDTDSGKSKTMSILIEYKSPFSDESNTYQLILDDSFETDKDPFESIVDISIDDDIITLWELADDHTVICEVKYSLLMMTKPSMKESSEVDTNTVYQTVMGAIMGSKQNGIIVAGFSSSNPDDGDEFDLEYGKKLSLKRALLSKIKIDHSIYKNRANQNSQVIKLIKNAIDKDFRIARHLEKRERQLKDTINSMIH